MSNKHAAEICEALGLKEVTKLTLRFEINKPVVAEVEMYVLDDSALEKATTVAKQYSLKANDRAPLPRAPKAVYLGDSVYVETNELGQIEMWLADGYGRKSTIVLEQPTFEALINLVKARWGDEWWEAFSNNEGAEGQS
jgi:hypothetical protein